MDGGGGVGVGGDSGFLVRGLARDDSEVHFSHKELKVLREKVTSAVVLRVRTVAGLKVRV